MEYLDPELTCPHCGTRFLPSEERQVYCSKICKQRAQNKRFYERHKQAERERLRQSVTKRRARERLRNAVSRSVKKLAPPPPPKPVDETEAALAKIMQRLDLTRGQAIARALREFAATLD